MSDLTYQGAKKIREKSFGSLLAEQEGGLGSSLKSAISLKTQAKMKGIKETFDPMNIAKKLTFGSNFAPAMVGKLMGRNKEDISHFTGAKLSPVGEKGSASKLESMEQSNGMLDMLFKIYTLLKETNEKNTLKDEEANNFKEEIESERNRRHQDLLNALKGLKKGGTTKTTTIPESTPFSFDIGNIPFPAVFRSNRPGGQGKTDGKGKATPETPAERRARRLEKVKNGRASKVTKVLKGAKGVLNFLKKIPVLSTLAAGISLISNISEAIEANEAGEITDTELKKEVVSSVGGALGGIAGAEIGALLGGAVGSVVPVFGTAVGGIAGGLAGFFGGEQIGKYGAEKLFDLIQNSDSEIIPKAATAQKIENIGYDNTGNPTGITVEPTPTTPPTQSQSNFGKSQRSVAAQKSIPLPAPNAGQQLNAAVSENNQLNLPTPPKPNPTVVSNSSTVAINKPSIDRTPIVAVRNLEPTYRGIIIETTRAV